ncbi:hypothetical protein DL768_008056 [Neofusicoccum parvum]|uniref:Uncharacterized protein n=1 Tax=Neofusicoccum parvum TaxID=310453 RepID=A0ACB5RQQ4_9PEZI|nr:hypothetical protein DL768_008056 [Neofusicoccum parvum]
MALEAATHLTRNGTLKTVEVQDLVIARPITFDDEATGVETLFTLTDVHESVETAISSANFKCFTVPNKDSAAMVLTASGTLRLDLGEPSSSALPPRNSAPPNLVEVDTQRFYSSLAELGYGYTGPFKGLSAMKRKLGAGTGLVSNPASTDPENPLLIHPAMLDSAFQAVFLAYCWPGDGALWSLHVPTHIARIRVNAELARSAFAQPGEFPFDCILSPSPTSPIYGDVDIYPQSGGHAIVQVEGMSAVPVSAATPADDRKVFEDIVWGLAYPDAESISDTRWDARLASLAAQVTFRYPHLRIIETANTGEGATQTILEKIGDAFESYTVALPSESSLEAATGNVNDERITFKTLDIEADVADQGFIAESYGMLIASGLSHETEKFEAALRNARLLLKPGGYILMLQPLHSQRSSSEETLFLSMAQCNSILRKAGFSGIDTVNQADGLSVLASQAVDDRILALRKPLLSTSTVASQEAFIIGGASLTTMRLVNDLEGLLQDRFSRVTAIDGVDSPDVDAIPSGAVVLSLTDLDEPTFAGLTTRKLEGLKNLFDKAQTVLWVTRGCLADDPHANMIVGFGRTLLLETSHLRLQFFDIDPSLTVTANTFAEALLQLQATDEWSGSDLVWTTEPELALTKDGLTIPRVIPSQARNDRYNSHRREITKEVDVKLSTVEIESRESSSYTLLERFDPKFAQASYSASNIDVVVSYSCLSSLKIEAVGYLFLVLGRIASSGDAVLALSETPASLVNVPEKWCVQCDVPAGKEASFLSSVAGYFSALPLLASVWPHESVLVHEPQPALAAALHKLSAERNANVYFLTTTKIPSEDHTSWLTVHPNSSRRAIKSILPQNISVFVTTSTGSESSDFQSRVASSLPEFHRRVDYSALWSRSSVIAADSPVDVDIREQLDSAAAFADLSFADAVVVGLNDLASVPSGTNLAVVDWTAASKVTATLEPVDSKPLFAKDKTYFLVGLAGDLGQSLTKWMIDHGARYIVLTSRNPRIDKQWLASFEGTGAVVKICPNDITNKSALQQLYKEISETLPPIAGVANGAMVLEDTPVADMTLEKMQKVLRPKVEGSMYLDELFGSGDLDFFVFFSSVASVVGNRGQSSYSAANAFMCSLAAQRRKRGLAASVIDIGAIVGTGYLTREVSQSVQDYLRKAGYMWMSETEFLQVFAEGVLASRPASGSGHEVASGLRMVKGEDKDAVWYSNPKFQHCVLGREEGGAAEAGAKQGLSVKAELADAAGPEEVHRIVTDAFTKKIQTTLLLSADNFILDQTADDLGIDSLVAVTIRSWFSKELGVDMPVMKILGGATVGSILDYAVERLPADLLPSGQQTPEPAQAAEETIGADQPSASPTHAASSASSETELSEPASWSSLDSKEEARLPTKAVPMSFGQSRFWFLESLLEDKTTSNVTCLVRLRGPLRVADLDRAVKAVGDRHEGLRTSFFDKDGQPMQGVLEKSSLRLETKAITNDAEVTAEFRKMEQHVFDLKSGDTMRIVLLSRSPTSHHLIVAYHHINMDGVSFMVLLTDIAKAYSGGALSAPAFQYPQFSEQQRKSFDRGEWKDQIAYWKREYADIPAPLPILPLSTVTTRKPMGRYDFHKAEVRMDAALRKRVQNTCRKQKITAFHFYVAVFQALLVRLTGVDDLSIGIADAGRVDDEAFGSIGNYLNLLPLHLKPSAARSFEQVLRETKTKVYEALANSSVPVDVLFKELGVARSPLHSPLFQAFVDYRSVQETQKFGDCEIEGEEYSIGRTGYDIALDVIDNTAGDSSLSIMVQKALYTEHDAGLLLRSFLALVDAFSADVSLQLQTPPLFEKVEIEKGLRLGRGPEFQHRWESLPHAVDAIAREHPSRTALRDGLGNALSYNAMIPRIHSIANALLETGVTADSRARVAVFQVPSVDWICSMLAIMRIGAAYVPLDLRSGLPRLAAVVNECQPQAIVVHADTIDDVSALGTGDMPVLDISLLPQRADAEVQNYASADSAGIILYTSGSTGTPKGIALSHRALQNQMEGCISRWGFDAEVVLQQSAYSFDLSVFQIYLALLTGGTSVSVPKAARGDAVAIVKIIADEGVTATCGVPSEYITWLRYGDSDLLRGSNYRMMVSGGEPFSTNLASELRALGKSDLRAMNLYGPAEATISATTIEVDYNQAEALERPAPAGYTVPNYSIYILDENLDPVPTGVPGQIAIAGSISSGYVNNDALDKERFVPDPFAPPEWKAKGWDRMHLSGDKGRLRPSDGALVFEGRIAGDTQIKLRGIRIELQDVESVIIDTAKGAIATAIASVRGDPAFLVAHVVFSPGHLLSKDEQPEFLERLVLSLPLPQYMRPTIIVPLDAMPLTVSGKIDRRAVGQLSLEDVKRKERRTSELSPTETKLKEIWESVATSDLASLYDIDADSDFFNVGGNSLLLMGLQSKIRETFGTTLSLLELFEASSLARMAARINNSKGDNILPLIDWESETKFDIDPDAVSTRARPAASKQKVIVLTGATGFLGKHILQQLLEDEEVLKVHCIALRSPSQLAHLRSERLHLHEGNLTLPRLGLTASAATQIFSEATDIIHNAADVSFMKTYHSLKPSNLTSTKNLLHLLLTTPGAPTSFHYISTAGIGQLSPAPIFHPTTAASSAPPPDGSNGYAATKWASERVLERAAQRFFPGLRVVVHRPSSITGSGAPALDVVQNLLGAARRLRALPALEQVWRGWVDLVAVERVAAGVVAEVRGGGEGGAAARYVHHSGDYEVPVEGLKAFLEGEEGVVFEVLERAEWVERARGVGINEMVAAYMEAQSGERPLLTPRIAKG